MTDTGATQSVQALQTARGIAAVRDRLGQWRKEGATVGAVPTMGALHEGHLALVRRAQADCDRVVVTLFVNPAQFNSRDDLTGYPRDEAADSAKLQELGVDLLFAPPVAEIYPPGFATKVSVSGITACLCGLLRPGHMDGVATVVTKLLLQILPDRAYFGEKDFQQYLVVQRLARDLDIPVRIEPVPTVRGRDGLALSSRNALLTPAQRRLAPTLYRVLTDISASLREGADAEELLRAGHEELTSAGFDPIDYLELRAADSLEPLAGAGRPARLFVAAWLGEVRLIDNVAV